MKRVRHALSAFVSVCGIALMGLFGAPAMALFALASGVRRVSDWLCKRIER